MPTSAELNALFFDYSIRKVQDNLDELIAGSNKRNFVLENSAYGEILIAEMINAACNAKASKADDAFEVVAKKASDGTTAAAATDTLAQIKTTVTVAERLAMHQAATLADRIDIAKVFGTTPSDEADVAKAFTLAAGFSEPPGSTDSTLYAGKDIAYTVCPAGLKMDFVKLTGDVSGTETDLIWSTDKWTTAGDTTTGVAPTKVHYKLREYTHAERIATGFVEAGASTVIAPTDGACESAVIGDSDALKAVQRQNLQLGAVLGFKVAQGSTTANTGDLAQATMDVMSSNMSIFKHKPSLAVIDANNAGFAAPGKKIVAASGKYNSEISALTVNSSLADYITVSPNTAPHIQGKGILVRLEAMNDPVAHRLVTFQRKFFPTKMDLVKFAADLDLTDTSSSDNSHSVGVVTPASSSALASTTWTSTAAKLSETMEVFSGGFSTTTPEKFSASGNTILVHLRQSSKATAKIPTGLASTDKVLLSFGYPQLTEWVADMLGPDNSLMAAIRQDAAAHAASEGISQLEYMRNIVGAKTSQNTAPAMLTGNEWPLYADNDFSIKQKVLETLIAALNASSTDADKLGTNGRFSHVNLAAAAQAGLIKSVKLGATDAYRQVVSKEAVFQGDNAPNTLVFATGTTDANEKILAKKVGDKFQHNTQENTRLVQTANGDHGTDDLTFTEVKSLVDFLGASSVLYLVTGSHTTDSHIGVSMAALAALQPMGSANRARMESSASIFTALDSINLNGANSRYSTVHGQWIKALYKANKPAVIQAIGDFFAMERGSDSHDITETESTYFLNTLVAYGIIDVVADVAIGDLDSVTRTLAGKQAQYVAVCKHFLDNYQLPEKSSGVAMAPTDLLANVDLNFTNAVSAGVFIYEHMTSNNYVKNNEAQIKLLLDYTVVTNCNVLIAVRSLIEDRQMDILDGKTDSDYEILISRGMLPATIAQLAYAESKISGYLVDAVQQTKVYLKRGPDPININ